MTLSRWKMMAVGLGVSLGGLAAIAGQCPKTDSTKGSPTTAAAPALDLPVIPASASAPGSAPKVMPPAPPASAALPELPPLPAATIPAAPPAAEPEKKPDTPVSSPALPTAPPVGLPMKTPQVPDVPPPLDKPTAEKPIPPTTTAPADPLVKPMATDLPSGPPAGIIYTKPTPPAIEPPSKVSPPPPPHSTDPLIGSPTRVSPPSSGGTVAPSIGTGVGPGPDTPPPALGGGTAPRLGTTPPASAPDLPAFDPPMQAVIGSAKAAPAVAQAATKFRILLRVGEGEPTFEVRCGDDLVLKVACERVDVKSPEKGSGLAAVKASGKVRFAGFGAEGTCDELSFLAGTGEVMMTGAVNVRVKDKLGRVESELSADSAKYKLDPCPTGLR
jgi:hypothetical protein